MIFECLSSSTLIITVLTLVLERAAMLGLNVHVDSALILLSKLTVGALKLARICANILEGHCY